MKKLYSSYRKWRKNLSLEKDGIIVASDITQEWLLPWWWDHYSQHNNLPVAFVDFGMSEEMKAWCKDHGQLIEIPTGDVFILDKDSLPPSLVEVWKKVHGENFWEYRNAWFKKPLACLQSPFVRSIWIDLDCEVRGSLHHLLDLCESPVDFAIAKDQNPPNHQDDPVMYNSGVIIFKHGIKTFEKWAEESIDNNHYYMGDQDILTKIIHDEKIPIHILSNLYNWSHMQKEPPGVVIYHLHNLSGKNIISTEIIKMKLQNWAEKN